MTDLDALRRWGCSVLGWDVAGAELRPVPGDASFRRYFRLSSGAQCVVLCDAPPDKEKNAEFVSVAEILGGAGVRVPVVHAVDLDRGWLCLEDLGDELLLPRLSAANVADWYGQALEILCRLATARDGADLIPRYDRAELQRELDLFPRWFCAELLGVAVEPAAQACFAELSELLCARALKQTQVVVHRDFHARNLMVLPGGDLAVIDFQDAVLGPVTYDPVSLLRDCYRRWPDEKVLTWALHHRDRLLAAGVTVPADDDAFLCDFDFMGLQRHIKVLGIFARLWVRDGKDNYLGDLPRVIAYTRDVLARYPGQPACARFLDWFDAELLPRATAQTWYTKP